MSAPRDKHQRLQQLAGALVRALAEERDVDQAKCRELIACLSDLIDGDVCDECLAIIPDEDGGDLANEYHAESCSLYAAPVSTITDARGTRPIPAGRA